MPNPDFDLYLVTDRNQTRGRDLLWVLEQALNGGVKAVQLREKDLNGRELYLLAEGVRKLTQRYQAFLFINDRIDIALAVDADGVQLGKTSVPTDTARQLLGPQKLIGVSTHSLEEARQAERSGADFVLFGPVHFTPTKADYGPPQGLDALKKIVDNVSLPVFAIGGMNPETIAQAKRIGIHGVALISAVMSASDPAAATLELMKLRKS